MKRKDVQRLAAELVDGIEQMRRELAMKDAQVQQLTAKADHVWAALNLACGLLSTYEDHSMFAPDQLVQQFLHEAAK